jgi:hypothetical protein
MNSECENRLILPQCLEKTTQRAGKQWYASLEGDVKNASLFFM